MTPEEAHKVAHGFLAVALACGRDTAAEARNYERSRLKAFVFPTGEVLAAELEEGIGELIVYASEGNRPSHELLKEIASDLTEKHLSLPLSLQEYIISPTYVGQRGRPPGSDWLQSAAIAGAVLALTEINDFQWTNSRVPAFGGKAESRESACSIVAAEARRFDIVKTAAAIEKITERFRDLAAVVFFERGKLAKKSSTKSI
jgi:hypothetical protein